MPPLPAKANSAGQRVLLAVLLMTAAVLITVGMFRWIEPAGWITAGLLLAGWALLFLLDVKEPPPAQARERGGDDL